MESHAHRLVLENGAYCLTKKVKAALSGVLRDLDTAFETEANISPWGDISFELAWKMFNSNKITRGSPSQF